jgi:hypothetical protein
MLYLLACTNIETGAVMSLENATSLDSAEVIDEGNDNTYESYPSLQGPIDGSAFEESESILFQVNSNSPVQIFIFDSEDLETEIISSQVIDTDSNTVDWEWSVSESWGSFKWYALNDIGMSVIWSFTKEGENTAPVAPTLEYPLDNSELHSNDVYFMVTGGEDPDGDQWTYTIQITKDGNDYLHSDTLRSEELPWTPDINFEVSTELCWTSWATDEKGDRGPSAVPWCFEVQAD